MYQQQYKFYGREKWMVQFCTVVNNAPPPKGVRLYVTQSSVTQYLEDCTSLVNVCH